MLLQIIMGKSKVPCAIRKGIFICPGLLLENEVSLNMDNTY